jgi:probable HAF family extracellular repeat protein
MLNKRKIYCELCLSLLVLTLFLSASLVSASPVTAMDIGTLSGDTSSIAWCINDKGQVVGESGTRAFLWTAEDGMVDISDGASFILLSRENLLEWV